MAGVKGLNTPYEDCAVPYQNPNESDGTEFGEPLAGGQAPTSGGEWKPVQFAKIDGGDAGAKNFLKIPGSGGNHN